MLQTVTWSYASERVDITSEVLTISKEDLSATFENGVIVLFDDLKLSTAKLVVYYSDLDSKDKKEMKKIVIPGKLKAVKNCGKEIIIADSGEFDNSAKVLTLNGNVQLQKEGNILVTDKLIYSAKFKAIEHKSDEK
ncbi:MAG: hypothetical protein Tsb006_2140 [Rickettsiaceae bacterium]